MCHDASIAFVWHLCWDLFVCDWRKSEKYVSKLHQWKLWWMCVGQSTNTDSTTHMQNYCIHFVIGHLFRSELRANLGYSVFTETDTRERLLWGGTPSPSPGELDVRLLNFLTIGRYRSLKRRHSQNQLRFRNWKLRSGSCVQSWKLFKLLPSGRRYRSLFAKTSRHKNSFFPLAVSLLNNPLYPL